MERPLEGEDKKIIADYFQRKQKVAEYIGFINFRVGGVDNYIDYKAQKTKALHLKHRATA